MSEDSPAGDRPDASGVGSVGDEAMKLFGALADLARQHTGDTVGGLGAMAGQAAGFAHEVDEHLATGSAECRYCPVCRVVHLARQTTPEVRAHLMTAATSLLQAAAGMMETVPPPAGDQHRRGPEVERIDLDADLETDTGDGDVER